MLATLERQKFRSFLRARFTLSRSIELFLDPVVVVACLILAVWYRGESLEARYVILGLISFAITFPGNLRLASSPGRMAAKAAASWLLVAAMLWSFGYASGYERFYPNKVIYTWFVLTLFALPFSHHLVRSALSRALADRRKCTAVIVGTNEVGVALLRQIRADQYSNVKPIGFFEDRSDERAPAASSLPVLGKLDSLGEYVKKHHVDHIYIALPMASQPRILRLLEELKDTTASIFFVPDIFVTDLIQARMDTVSGMPVVAVCETPFTGVDGALKRGSDIVISSLILLLISPILLAVAVGVRLSSPGPVVFKQRRYGLDGREIIVYKFRSMTVTEDGASTYKQVTRGDSRVTPFGAFIRKSSLDELPQFINVLQGRMSIVGPRPHAVAVNESYRKLIPGYMVRHKVKPGITGWAQVNGYRGGDDLQHMIKRIEYDLEYLRNWSLELDLKIIVKTFLVVFKDVHAY